MDVFGKVCAAILVFYMIFVYPLQHIVEVNDMACSSFVETKCTEFVNDILMNGKITTSNYEKLREELSDTGELYDIILEHSHIIIGVENHSNLAKQNCIMTQNALANEKVHMNVVYTEEKSKDDTRTVTAVEINMITTTVEKYSEFPIKSITVQYSDGSEETIEEGWEVFGYQSNQAGSYNVKVSFKIGELTTEAYVTVTVTNLKTVCSICNQMYEMNEADIDEGCPYCNREISSIKTEVEYYEVQRGEPLNIVVVAVYEDGHEEKIEGWTSNFSTDEIGLQNVKIEYEHFCTQVKVKVVDTQECKICHKSLEVGAEGTMQCPYCYQELVAITVTPMKQQLNYGENLDLSVMGTYRDGHTEEIQGYQTSYEPYFVGIQKVEVSYGFVSNIIEVEVLPVVHNCSECGHSYDISQSSSGCPYCANEVVKIEASLLSDGAKVQLGSDLKLKIMVVYRDQHRQMIWNDYSYENYDKNQLGVQNVIVHYKGFRCDLKVEVVNALIKKVCANGHVYHLNLDGSNSSCPYCDDVSSELQNRYFMVRSTEEILATMYQDGVYTIPSGDSISIIVKRKQQKAGILSMITHVAMLTERRDYTYGGEVK